MLKRYGRSYISYTRTVIILCLLFAFMAAGCASVPQNNSHAVYEKSSVGVDQFVEVNGYNVHYVEAGLGRPVVLIPGAFSTYRVWNRLIPKLSQRFRVIAINYVGVGDSDKPERGFDCSVKSQADIIAETIRSMNLGKVRLVGVSYGSGIALSIAGRYPWLVESVICIEGGAFILPEQLNHSKAAALLGIPIIGDIFLGVLKTGVFDKVAAKRVMGAAWEKLTSSEQEEVLEIVATNVKTASRIAWYHIYRSITSPLDFTEELRHSSVPIRYLYGEHSIYRELSQLNADIIKRIALNAEVISFDDGIHDLELQYPRKVFDAITTSWGRRELASGLPR
ncbi:MAG: alpha/beta fold hydrolase [Dissulfurispiraceae bacterium]